jgi:hypothetical protein
MARPPSSARRQASSSGTGWISATKRALVQHWLDKRDQARPNDHEMVVCPACAKIHFVNRQTGKLLGHKD